MHLIGWKSLVGSNEPKIYITFYYFCAGCKCAEGFVQKSADETVCVRKEDCPTNIVPRSDDERNQPKVPEAEDVKEAAEETVAEE